nr:hypothetical protein [Tanacetum cinerariifolium]
MEGDDPIACLNNAMAFMSTVKALHFPLTNYQLIISSNLRNQATIQDGRVTVQQVQERQDQRFAGTRTKGDATSFGGNNAAEKMLLVQAHESGQVLDEEQLAFLADLRVVDVQVSQTTFPQNTAFQTDDLDAYDLDCDDISLAKAVLTANLSSYDSNVLFEMFEQMSNHVTNWDKVNQETKTANESLIDELERYKERIKTFKQKLNIDLISHEKLIDSKIDDMIRNRNALKLEINSFKYTLSKHVKEKE